MSRRRAGRTDRLVLVFLAAAGGSWWAIMAAVQWARQNPATSSTAGIAACGLAAYVLQAWFRRRRPRTAAVRRLAALGDGTGKAAEQLVADLLERDGCTGVRVCGGGGDLGADVIGQLPGGGRVVVQVKDYAKPIGSPAIQTFNGTCWSVHEADRAVFVTTSSFTRAAAAFAGRSGIELVDRGGLAAWVAGDSIAA